MTGTIEIVLGYKFKFQIEDGQENALVNYAKWECNNSSIEAPEQAIEQLILDKFDDVEKSDYIQTDMKLADYNVIKFAAETNIEID